MTKFRRSPALIIQEGKFLENNAILAIFGIFAIYSMIIPIIILDIWTILYQFTYFGINHIPKIKRSDYIVLDRWKLKGLTIWQRFNCFYCEYVNGMLAWAKAIANQTEAYSCAIKHSVPKQAMEHAKEFYEYERYR